ncbi:MAG TPA: hypothetical protein VK455_02405 [Thermoplasmata archaeon]|nr:hypothetical protein [Thermoplasmata archaeon]
MEQPAGPTVRERKENRSGTQRAVRVSLLFVLAIAVLYGGFVLLAGSASDRTGPGVWQQIELFGLIAIAVSVGGTLLTLGSAPRAIETDANGTVVVGRFGRHRRYAAGVPISVRLVQKHPAGFLSPTAIDVVEVTAGPQRATYFLEEGMLAITDDGRASKRR